MSAIAHGSVLYGLSIRSNLNNLENDDDSHVTECVVASRVLKYTYWTTIHPEWVSHYSLINSYI